MPYREIADDGGDWIVFSTQPRSGANVRPRYAGGWLSFHRGTQRRRLSPIPEGWEGASGEQLRLWLLSAELVASSTEDDEGPGGTEGERRGLLIAAPAPAVDAVLVPQASAPAATAAPAPASPVQQGIERIRAMLSEIRTPDV
jgi:hypothetical protein